MKATFYVPVTVWKHYLEYYGIKSFTTADDIVTKLQEKMAVKSFLEFIRSANIVGEELVRDRRISVYMDLPVEKIFELARTQYCKKIIGKEIFFRSKNETWIYELSERFGEYNITIGKFGIEKWLATHVVYLYGLRLPKLSEVEKQVVSFIKSKEEESIIQSLFRDLRVEIARQIKTFRPNKRIYMPYVASGLLSEISGKIADKIFIFEYCMKKAIAEKDDILKPFLDEINPSYIEYCRMFCEDFENMMNAVKDIVGSYIEEIKEMKIRERFKLHKRIKEKLEWKLKKAVSSELSDDEMIDTVYEAILEFKKEMKEKRSESHEEESKDEKRKMSKEDIDKIVEDYLD